MGYEIVYCGGCSVRLTSAQFDNGEAVRLRDRVACKNCIGDLLPDLTPGERAVLKPRNKRPTSRTKVRPPRQTTRIRQLEPAEDPDAEPPSGRGKLILGVVGGVFLFLVGLLLFLLWGGEESIPSDVNDPGRVVRRKKTPEAIKSTNPREEKAAQAIKESEEIDRSTPDDLESRIAAWSKAVEVSGRTSHFDKARAAHAALVKMLSTKLSDELDGLRSQSSPALEKGDYGAAAGIFESARNRFAASLRSASLISARVGSFIW